MTRVASVCIWWHSNRLVQVGLGWSKGGEGGELCLFGECVVFPGDDDEVLEGDEVIEGDGCLSDNDVLEGDGYLGRVLFVLDSTAPFFTVNSKSSKR